MSKRNEFTWPQFPPLPGMDITVGNVDSKMISAGNGQYVAQVSWEELRVTERGKLVVQCKASVTPPTSAMVADMAASSRHMELAHAPQFDPNFSVEAILGFNPFKLIGW